MSIQNTYNKWSEAYDSNENLTRDLDQQVTRDTLANQKFESILELGCGPAFFWRSNLEHIPDDWEIVLSDFSPGMLQKAQHILFVAHG